VFWEAIVFVRSFIRKRHKIKEKNAQQFHEKMAGVRKEQGALSRQVLTRTVVRFLTQIHQV